VNDSVVIPRLSATVIPVRPSAGESGLETLMIERAHDLRVLPGFLVFPGGVLEPVDVTVADFWSMRGGGGGEAVQALLPDFSAVHAFAWTRDAWLGGDSPEASRVILSLLSAGLRELAEEIGWCALPRAKWTERELISLRTGETDVWQKSVDTLSVRPQLRYLGRRVTPPALRHRYDTHFFVALWESGDEVQASRSEVARAFWVNPRELLERGDELLLAPPTVDALKALADCAGIHELYARGELPAQVNDPSRVEWLRQRTESL